MSTGAGAALFLGDLFSHQAAQLRIIMIRSRLCCDGLHVYVVEHSRASLKSRCSVHVPVPITATGLQGEKPLVSRCNVSKGTRQNGSVTSGEGLALIFRTLSFKGNLTV